MVVQIIMLQTPSLGDKVTVKIGKEGSKDFLKKVLKIILLMETTLAVCI